MNNELQKDQISQDAKLVLARITNNVEQHVKLEDLRRSLIGRISWIETRIALEELVNHAFVKFEDGHVCSTADGWKYVKSSRKDIVGILSSLTSKR